MRVRKDLREYPLFIGEENFSKLHGQHFQLFIATKTRSTLLIYVTGTILECGNWQLRWEHK